MSTIKNLAARRRQLETEIFEAERRLDAFGKRHEQITRIRDRVARRLEELRTERALVTEQLSAKVMGLPIVASAALLAQDAVELEVMQ